MSTVLFEETIDFLIKKGKWKKCICLIHFKDRIKLTLCALIQDIESHAIIETIDIYGYKCGVNTVEFVFIGRKYCHSIRFKDIDRMIELETVLKEYINDVNYFVQLEDCKKGDTTLTLKDWYRLHVQINRVCLTTDKSNELIKIWNNCRIGQVILTDCCLSIEVESEKDRDVYKFHHDAQMVLKDIYDVLMERKYNLSFIQTDQIYLMKRKSEIVDLKRFNSCSNSREMKKGNRSRTLSSTITNEYDYDDSMPSTPAYINLFHSNVSSRNQDNTNEYGEPSLVFQMDSLDCGSIDSSGIYGTNQRHKADSEGFDTISTEFDSKTSRKVGLEKYPFESEFKDKINISPSSTNNDSDSYDKPYNKGIVDRPNNGKFYQSINSLRSNMKTSFDVNLSDITQPTTEMSYSQINEKKDDYRENLKMFSDNNKCSSSSYLHTPSPSSNVSSVNQAILINPIARNGLNSNYVTPVYKETQYSLPNSYYYNLSNHINNAPPNHSSKNNKSSYNNHNHNHNHNNHEKHRYFNFINTLQSDPVDIKPKKDEDKKLNYIKLDFADFSSYDIVKHNSNVEYDSNYKVIDIKNTEALKALDEYSFPKTQKKSLLKFLTKK